MQWFEKLADWIARRGGTCRQFMLDFAPLKVILDNMEGDEKHTTANKLLPLKFERRTKL